jgi:hypothetical protein
VRGLRQRQNVLRILQQLQTTLFQHRLRLPYHVAVRRFGFNADCTSRYSSVNAYQRPTRLILVVAAENPARPAAGWWATRVLFRSGGTRIRTGDTMIFS